MKYKNTFDVLWYCIECTLKTDMEEKSLFLFSLCTKSIIVAFIKLGLNHWCHMDYINDVLTMGLDCDSCVAVYVGSESSWI